MDTKHAKEILERYRLGTCSEEEKSWVENWHLQQLKESSYTPDTEQLSAIHEEVKNKVDLHIRHNIKQIRRKTRIVKISTVAASLLLLIGIGYFSTKQSYTPSDEDNTSAQLDIQPGGNRAILTSSDGSTTELSENNNTILVGDNISYAEGPDIRQSGSTLKVEAVAFHTLQTPKAGEYNIVLSDGTKVWLNAYSSLKFPSRFDAKERLVELTGEAYFEVAPNKSKPFKVRSQDQTIEVLGTHFNVSAYQSESTKTTLLEGSVKIYTAANNNSKLLKPGQQSTINRQSEQIQLANINPEHALAWKNGYFNFDNETLASIMSKIERWYDVEVEFEKAPSEKTYIGAVSRLRNLSAVLRALEETANVKFKRSGRKIIVTS